MTLDRSSLFLALVLAGFMALPGRGATVYLPVDDNQGPPYLGVLDTSDPDTDAYAAWLNRTTIFGNGVFSGGTGSDWNSIASASSASWFLVPASAWIQESPGRVMVIGVPILPGPTNDSGPTTGPGQGPVSLAQGAAGTYNTYFYSMGQNLVAAHLGNSILRLGWEFNGNWYAWSVLSSADAANFAAFWKQIVNTLRTVPGQNFKFLWGGALTYVGSTPPFTLSQAFPSGNDASGRPYVDYVGLDVYDENWNYYPWATGSTTAQIAAARANVWNNMVMNGTAWWGVPVWTAIATANHIPITFPEWGLSTDAHGGLDDTAFVQNMYNFIQNPANNVYFHAYYDSEGSKISPTEGYVTTLVNSAALYRQLFSIPTPTSFSAWQAWQFTSTQRANSAVSGLQASPAGDGTTNLMKYALELSSARASAVNLAPQVVGNHLTLTYQRLTNPTDLHYIAEVSTDLVNWSSTTVTSAVTTADTGTGKETITATDSVALPSASPRFMRLRVTSP